ncbi:hypothetical protein C8K36_108226 [Rhodococcus sp. OK519]|nr:hypothetical protein C8K36_108226 [Rhodococcus sp. OK519]
MYGVGPMFELFGARINLTRVYGDGPIDKGTLEEDVLASFVPGGHVDPERQRLPARTVLDQVRGSLACMATSRQSDLDIAKRLILDSLVVVDSTEVARILAPAAASTPSVAQEHRQAGDLIGLPVGARPNYLYPVFQFDTCRHRIYDVVRHANRRLYVGADPYGSASWWLTATDMLDGNSPLEDLEAGQFTEIAVDNVIDHARRGM